MPRKRQPPRLIKRPDAACFYIKDGKERFTTGTTDAGEAEQCLAQYIVQITSPPTDPTIGKLLDLRLKSLEGKASHKNMMYFHNTLKKTFKDMRPGDLNKPLLAMYRTKRKEAPASLREELLVLRSILLHSGHDQKIVEVPKPRAPRERFLTRVEVQRLLEATKSQHLHTFILIAMTTGHRAGAILGLTWNRVNFEKGFLDFNDPDMPVTNKKRTTIPVGSGLLTALRDVQQFAQTDNISEYMGKPCKSIKKAFSRSAARADLSWASPHVLKHSVISWMAENRYTADQASDLTATDVKTVKRIYRKFDPEYLREVANTLDISPIGLKRSFGKEAKK